jgi:hypothetical protein
MLNILKKNFFQIVDLLICMWTSTRSKLYLISKEKSSNLLTRQMNK